MYNVIWHTAEGTFELICGGISWGRYFRDGMRYCGLIVDKKIVLTLIDSFYRAERMSAIENVIGKCHDGQTLIGSV